MESDLRIDILANGALVSIVWWIGAYFAAYRKRWMLAIGSAGAGFSSVVFTILSGGGHAPGLLVDIASYARLPVAVLLVGSFIWNQPRGPRPDSWLP